MCYQLSRGKNSTARFFNSGYLIRIEESWKQYFKIRQQEIRGNLKFIEFRFNMY